MLLDKDLLIKINRMKKITVITVALFSSLYITSCSTDILRIESEEYELSKAIFPSDCTKKIYYGVKEGKVSYPAVYAYFCKDTLYQIQIARNDKVIKQNEQSKLFNQTDIEEQISLFHQIFSFISKKNIFDKVERIMINPSGLKAMSLELLQKYDSNGDYVKAIKDCYYFSKLFELFKSYGISVKEIEVNDIYWETIEEKGDLFKSKDDKWDNIDLNALIIIYTDKEQKKQLP